MDGGLNSVKVATNGGGGGSNGTTASESPTEEVSFFIIKT
jgi:hypothetical protein